MAITVSGVSIRHNGKVYGHGDTIDKIKVNEAKRLVDLGFASFNEKDSNQEKDNESVEGNE